MKELTIFERIIKGEIPAAKLYEDQNFIVILDAFPVVPAHTLVVPKKPESYIFDLDNKMYEDLMKLSKKVAEHLKVKTNCKRVCMSVIGWEVPHVHVHLIPTNQNIDLTFGGPGRKKATAEELKPLVEKLKM